MRVLKGSSGLSPLARGTLLCRLRRHKLRRFIPAGAGNTEIDGSEQHSPSVYPRWRGEHRWSAGDKILVCGLSPLARGTHQCRELTYWPPRFIPAGAGNTFPQWSGTGSVSVYPRWRGEHCACAVMSPFLFGLSPLARGTPKGWRRWRPGIRFIPAGAGNTKIKPRAHSWATVYPRWRGEHGVYYADLVNSLGLSPLARGTQSKSYPRGSYATVYPRWRGEHERLPRLHAQPFGLSPLARGTPPLTRRAP